MISAWVAEQELVLGQMCVEEKTNAIPTVPLLLELLDISGCIVTADAMSCQREIAKKIMDGKGDYVLSLKENQPTLHECAETYFKDAMEQPQRYPEMETCETVNKGHGRIEKKNLLSVLGLVQIGECRGLGRLVRLWHGTFACYHG